MGETRTWLASPPHTQVEEKRRRQDADEGHIVFDARIPSGSELFHECLSRTRTEDAILFYSCRELGVLHIATIVAEKAPAVRCPIGLFMPRPDRFWYQSFHSLRQQVLLVENFHFQLDGQLGSKLHDPVVQEWVSPLDGMSQ